LHVRLLINYYTNSAYTLQRNAGFKEDINYYRQTFYYSILYYHKPLSLSVYKQHTFTSDTTHYYTSEINVKQKLNNNVSDYMYCNFFIVKTNNNNNNNYKYFFFQWWGRFWLLWGQYWCTGPCHYPCKYTNKHVHVYALIVYLRG
jgi:hypothetical protein